MKKPLLLLLLLCPFFTWAQKIDGAWSGKLNAAGITLTLVFNFEKNEAGYIGTLDSPDQNLKGLPLSSVIFKDDSLFCTITEIAVSYKAKLINDTLVGIFSQMGQNIPLNLQNKKGRPQEPKAPFSYNSEDIKFYNPQAQINLAGTFTYPKSGGKFPVVVLVTGSGAQDRNEEIFGHKPFLVLSDYLCKHGIAVLRFDDRGVGESEGDFAKATTSDFATDAYAAVEYLKTRKEIDENKIGIIGHSEGGTIALKLAGSYPQDISFIVSMAGTAMSGKDILYYQSKEMMLSSGVTEAEAEKNQKLAMSLIDYVEKYDEAYLKTNAYSLVSAILPEDQQTDEIINSMINQLATMSSPWFREFIAYNPAVDLDKINADVFALNGEKDSQVSVDNLTIIDEKLVNARSKKIKKYPNLNHLFQTANTGFVSEYAEIEETIAPEVLSDIANWINSLKFN